MEHSFKPTKRYLQAFGALYGDVEIKPSRSKPAKKQRNHEEDDEQTKAAAWLDKNNILFYHIPNGGKRNLWEAVKFKRMGVKAGVPDICIPLPSKEGHHGLYIELKRKSGGVVSDHQEWWLSILKQKGYDVYVAQGANDLIQYVKNYMEHVE